MAIAGCASQADQLRRQAQRERVPFRKAELLTAADCESRGIGSREPEFKRCFLEFGARRFRDVADQQTEQTKVGLLDAVRRSAQCMERGKGTCVAGELQKLLAGPGVLPPAQIHVDECEFIGDDVRCRVELTPPCGRFVKECRRVPARAQPVTIAFWSGEGGTHQTDQAGDVSVREISAGIPPSGTDHLVVTVGEVVKRFTPPEAWYAAWLHRNTRAELVEAFQARFPDSAHVAELTAAIERKKAQNAAAQAAKEAAIAKQQELDRANLVADARKHLDARVDVRGVGEVEGRDVLTVIRVDINRMKELDVKEQGLLLALERKEAKITRLRLRTRVRDLLRPSGSSPDADDVRGLIEDLQRVGERVLARRVHAKFRSLLEIAERRRSFTLTLGTRLRTLDELGLVQGACSWVERGHSALCTIDPSVRLLPFADEVEVMVVNGRVELIAQRSDDPQACAKYVSRNLRQWRRASANSSFRRQGDAVETFV